MDRMFELIKYLFSLFKKLFPYLLLIGFGLLCWRWFEFASANQQDIYTPIVNGVIGGIVTSFLILVFSILWRSNITPWIENLLYKDTEVAGGWTGVLVPFIGIEEIDKRRVKIALGVIRRRRKKRKNESEKDEEHCGTDISASVESEDGSKNVEAELILKKKKSEASDEYEEEKRVVIGIASPVAPIEVRVEFRRTGHSLTGQVVEIGGASQVHTYSIKGSFKNLILTGEYENEDGTHIDRGSLSLMLLNNGKTLEGFFSSYADSDHRVAPFKCLLNRQHRIGNE